MKTKKSLFFLLLAMLAPITLTAQIQDEEVTRKTGGFFGVGLSLSQLGDYDMGLNTTIEVGYKYQVSSFLLMPSLRYTTRKTTQTIDYGNIASALGTWSGKYEAKLNPDYLEIPIRLGYQYETGKIDIRPYIGPYIAYGTTGSVEATLETGTPGGSTKKSKTSNDFFGDNTSRFDAGFLIGAQVGFQTSGGRGFVQLEYNAGMTKPSKNSDNKWKFFLFTIGVGV